MLHADKIFALSMLPGTDIGYLDMRLMERVLDNLVNNALRFYHSRITVSVSRDGPMVCLQVDDDGPGIAQEDRETVFDPFIRLEAVLENSRGGCGLGLAIVYAIVQAYDGTIVVESNEWGGAHFRFCWPIKTDIPVRPALPS